MYTFSNPDQRIQVYATRVYGIHGDQLFSNESTSRHIEISKQILNKAKIRISAVAYGSFIWDLGHAREKYCFWTENTKREISLLDFVCDKEKSKMPLVAGNSNPADIIETWNNLELPWCNSTSLSLWKTGITKNLSITCAVLYF